MWTSVVLTGACLCCGQFYRDTLEEAEEVQAETSKEERSPPSLEKMETNDAEEVAMDEEGEDNSEPPTIDMENNQDTAADSNQGQWV